GRPRRLGAGERPPRVRGRPRRASRREHYVLMVGPGVEEGMRRRSGVARPWRAALALAWLAGVPGPALAQEDAPRENSRGAKVLAAKGDFEGISVASVKQLYKQYQTFKAQGKIAPSAVPDIFGHGAVLSVGKVVEKVTNFGFNGNPFTNTSS